MTSIIGDLVSAGRAGTHHRLGQERRAGVGVPPPDSSSPASSSRCSSWRSRVRGARSRRAPRGRTGPAHPGAPPRRRGQTRGRGRGARSSTSPRSSVSSSKRREPSRNPRLVLDGDVADLPLPAALQYVSRVHTLVMIIVASARSAISSSRHCRCSACCSSWSSSTSVPSTAVTAHPCGRRRRVRRCDPGRPRRRLAARTGTWSPDGSRSGHGAISPSPCVSHRCCSPTSLAVALPFLALAGCPDAAPIAPLEAARLDVVHPQLRGRAESARMIARVVAQAAAPLLFGLLSSSSPAGAPPGFSRVPRVPVVARCAARCFLLARPRSTRARSPRCRSPSSK